MAVELESVEEAKLVLVSMRDPLQQWPNLQSCSCWREMTGCNTVTLWQNIKRKWVQRSGQFTHKLWGVQSSGTFGASWSNIASSWVSQKKKNRKLLDIREDWLSFFSCYHMPWWSSKKRRQTPSTSKRPTRCCSWLHCPWRCSCIWCSQWCCCYLWSCWWWCTCCSR